MLVPTSDIHIHRLPSSEEFLELVLWK
eukprot:COSAG02_NODE_23152_length_728_cov_1.282989_1_plen_26_part_10